MILGDPSGLLEVPLWDPSAVPLGFLMGPKCSFGVPGGGGNAFRGPQFDIHQMRVQSLVLIAFSDKTHI